VVEDIDIRQYLACMGRWSPKKDPPAFDNLGFHPNPDGSFENLLFAGESTRTVTYTDWALRKLSGDPSAAVSADIKERVRLMNAMSFLGSEGSKNNTKAAHIFLRHGSFDRDTSFTVPINLYTKLKEAGVDVDFDFGWGQAHAGDYDEDEAFVWLTRILART
jgi:acetyl esterase/lipase